MKEKYLSVIIPCYNEMANLQKGVLEKIVHVLEKKEYDYEVVIVDDGSKDGSIDFIKEYIKEYPTFQLVENRHTGKAGAVTTGMLKGTGKYRLFTDMDQATPIEEVEKLLSFAPQYDIVIGSRNTERKGSPWTRIVMARGMIIIRKLIVGIYEINDTQCGFKLFSEEASEKLFAKIETLHKGFKKISGSSVTAGFDVELLYLAKKMGYSIKEVPVRWLYVETRRVSPIKDSIEGLLELLKIRMNALQKKYN